MPTIQQQERGQNAEEDHAVQLGATKVGTKGGKHIIIRGDNIQGYMGEKYQGFQPHHGRNRNLRVPPDDNMLAPLGLNLGCSQLHCMVLFHVLYSFLLLDGRHDVSVGDTVWLYSL